MIEMLIKNKLVLIDNEDVYLLIRHGWCLKDDKYLVATIKGKRKYLHQLILNTNKLIDHIDRNPLNNQRSNLRIVTKSQNSMNSKLRSDNKSGMKGVTWNKEKNSWECRIKFNGKTLF